MWESFNRLTEITQLCRWVKTETGLFFFTRSPGENSPTSRHKPIKADEKAVIYQAIMLRLHTCVPEEKKKKRANDSLETDTWHLLNQTIYSEKEMNHFYLFSFQSLIIPSLSTSFGPTWCSYKLNRSISLHSPCHQNKKGLCRIRAGERTLLLCKRDWRHFSAPQREGWTAESTWAGKGQIH